MCFLILERRREGCIPWISGSEFEDRETGEGGRTVNEDYGRRVVVINLKEVTIMSMTHMWKEDSLLSLN